MASCDDFRSWMAWQLIRRLCPPLYRRYGPDLDFPDGLPNPFDVFEALLTYKNYDWGNFVTFVLWMTSHYSARCCWRCYRQMRKAYPWAIPTWHALLSVAVPAATMRPKKKKNTNKKKKPPTWGQQYKDPGGPGSLGGLHRFARTHRQRVQRLRPHLEKELAYTLHKPVRCRFSTLRVQVWGIDHQWVADLVEVQRLAKHNGGTRYLLTMLDVLSKYAWVEPLKDKNCRSLAQAWERLLKRVHPRRPRQLQTDQGKEFYNRLFQQVLKKHAIHHFSTYGDTKASVIERFNRTLKERLYRYLTATNTLTFVDVLPQVV